MTHILKIQEDFADAIISGDKTFEIRKNDRGYQKGDYVKFDKVIERGSQLDCFDVRTHSIRNKLYVITYVMSGWGLKEDFVVFGIKEVSTTTTNNDEIAVMEYPQVPGVTPVIVADKSLNDMPCITEEELQKCRDIKKKYTPKGEE